MIIRNILLLFCFALFLISCNILSDPSEPDYQDLLCVINADGTGFQKLLNIKALPFPLYSLWDLYVTKDERLIFAADRLYITDPDSIDFKSISDLLTDPGQRLCLSSDDKVFYCSHGDLFKYDLNDNFHMNMTNGMSGHLMNPNISSDNSIIALYQGIYSPDSIRTLCYLRLSNDSLYTIPQAGLLTANGIYNSLDHNIYHEQNNGLYSIDINGLQNNQLSLYNSSPNGVFGLTPLNESIVTFDSQAVLRVFDIESGTTSYTKQLSYNCVTPKISKNTPKIFYDIDGMIYLFNTKNQTTQKVPNTSGVEFVMCPTWDGTKIYYIAHAKVN